MPINSASILRSSFFHDRDVAYRGFEGESRTVASRISTCSQTSCRAAIYVFVPTAPKGRRNTQASYLSVYELCTLPSPLRVNLGNSTLADAFTALSSTTYTVYAADRSRPHEVSLRGTMLLFVRCSCPLPGTSEVVGVVSIPSITSCSNHRAVHSCDLWVSLLLAVPNDQSPVSA